MTESQKAIRDFYKSRIQDHQQRLDAIERQSTWLSRLRGVTFLPALILFVVGWSNPNANWPWVLGGLFFAAFVLLAGCHETILRRAEEIRHRRKMSERQIARMNRNWKQIPEIPIDVPRKHQNESRDLDLFGHASVFQLVSMANTPFGCETLRDWLLEPATPDEVSSRHEAVEALRPDVDLREELHLRGRLLSAGNDGPKRFAEWGEGPSWLASRLWLLWTARLFTALFALSLVFAIAGTMTFVTFFIGFLIILAISSVINVLFTGTILAIFTNVSSQSHSMTHYRELLRMIADLPSDNAFFNQLKEKMGTHAHEPLERLNQLSRIIGIANLRQDGIFGIPYLIAQLMFLIDVHLLVYLERWQQQHGRHVRSWLETVGQLEAIASLAMLAHDNPDWTLPKLDNTDPSITATQLGHPLLKVNECIRNDVELGPTGTFLLVTGSNMSGKSTLLRSLGVNVALAQAGGPVCASEFQLTPLRIATSMRITDSLEDGVSFFMAELKRLKQIVDQSRSTKDNDPTLLYLLDEILQGTNSSERHIAVSRVIRHLVENGAIGAVSTHDLDLAKNPDLADVCKAVHFRESFADKQMTFDYKMQSGVSPTTNALKLLELVGLNE